MKVALFIAFVLVAISWQKVSAEKTLIVGSQQTTCHGPFLRKCLQVKYDASADWTTFYPYIQGFEFESGYEYVLKVKDEQIPNPPPDSSSVKYTLVEQVSKTKV